MNDYSAHGDEVRIRETTDLAEGWIGVIGRDGPILLLDQSLSDAVRDDARAWMIEWMRLQ